VVHSDGLQRSTRCPGGVALRYRDDKPAAEADTIERVRAVASAIRLAVVFALVELPHEASAESVCRNQ
jgi:hypothetical protein